MLGFLNEHLTQFYITKGLMGLLGVVLYMTHLQRAMPRAKCRGQRWRYYTLLAYAVLTTSASGEQLAQQAEVNWRNVAGLWVAALLVISAVISIRHDHRLGDPCGYHRPSS